MMKKIFWFLICAALFACTDDNNFTDTPAKPVFMDETVLARSNDFYGINIPGGADWEVTEHPFWAVPMKYEGTAGTPLQIFVELNDEDEDRRDTLLVDLANGSTVTIPLRQHGLASSDENSSITIDARTLNQVYGVGFGVDVVEKSGMTGIKYNVKKDSPFNFGNLQQLIEKKNWDDVIIDEPVYSSRYETITGSSTDALSNQLGINAGIEVGIKAFKFNVEAGFSSSSSGNTRNSYAMLEMQHIVGSRYFRGGMMRYLAEHADELDKLLVVKTKNKFAPKTESPSLFQKTFNQQVGKLKDNSSKGDVQAALKKLVETYGTHVITRGTLGGELCVSMRKQEDNSSSGTSIHAALGVSAKVLDAEGNFKMDDKDSAATANTTISLRSYGGINAFTIAPGTTFEGFLANLRGKDHRADSTISINMWAEGIRRKDSIMVKDKKEPSLALIDMETIPLWDLMPDERTRTLMRNYIVKDYQESVARNHNTTFTPDLFVVKDYDVTTNAPGSGSIYIPEIDMQMVFERTIIDKLDPNELSTVVYSGTKDNVNRNRGFFVGSSTRKPCKFCFEKNGSFTTEEFDRLYKEPICELYVDVTGDITIATKGVDEMYVTQSVNNWKHDLKMLSKDWTFDIDVTVTGTTDKIVHIADGKTLTLDNATVNNQLICDGNATIVLKDGTTNSISQGIVNGPEGTTLNITGNGQLTATGKEFYPGIGNGNGNIIISGGTVKALGRKGAAGIGSGKEGHCGDITIKSTVTYVEATCEEAEYDCEAIGFGDYGTCGTVTIEDPSKVKEINPNPAKINLDKLTSDFRLPERNCILTGTTDYAITIPDSIQVELAKSTINNQVTCEGNVTIILQENTLNMIYGKRGTDAATFALLNGPAGTTLTIDGKGELFCNVLYADMPGIGGGAGNIHIKGGIVQGIGSEKSAGIGSGPNGTVGNITISGGEVFCTGSAALGAGHNGKCGNILIQNCKLHARGFEGGPSIGSGAGGSCGNIVIKRGSEVKCELYTYGNVYVGAVQGGTCGTVTIENGTNITYLQEVW